MLDEAEVDPERGASIDLISLRLTKAKPQYVRMVGTADFNEFRGQPIIRVHRMLPPPIKREKAAHELGEWRAHTTRRRFRSLLEREAWCDAVGARLLCPTRAMRRVVSHHGHRVHAIAEAFGVTQGMSLLRIGEVTGRPVALLRRPGVILRGEDYAWPDEAELARLVRRPPASVHPIRVDDRWGLMASFGWQCAA